MKSGTRMNVVLVEPCPPHRWAFAPTVGYYECMKCSERRDWNHPAYAEAEREYRAPIDPAMTDEQVKHLVERFLSWKLPENFSPDGVRILLP
jgi:hypothetical protein